MLVYALQHLSLSGMWERTLQDLVRGLRANKKDEAKFISKAVDEIRQEIKTDDMELKAGAVLKLTYVCMLAIHLNVLLKLIRRPSSFSIA